MLTLASTRFILQCAARSRSLHSHRNNLASLLQPSFTVHLATQRAAGNLCPRLQRGTGTTVLNFVDSKIWNATHRDTRFRLTPSRHRESPYRPSSKSSWLESIPPQFIFWGILVLNGIVYFLWGHARSLYENVRDPSVYYWMSQNFLVNMQNVKEGRIWCLLTACFSHESISHLAFNGLSYFFMAPPVLALLGNTGFLALYLGSGIFASVASLTWRSLRGGRPTDSSHGASAAIYSIVAFFTCLQPRTTFLIFAVIPCPAWAFVTGILLFDGYSAILDKVCLTRGHRIDSVGHISGLVAGAAYFFLRRGVFRL